LLVTVKFPFAPFNRQDSRIGFESRKKGKYQRAKKFIEKIKEIQEAKATLERVQEEIKKYADKKRKEVDDYKVEDLVILSTKDLKYQMVRRRTEKLIERFVGLYKIKKIVSSNAVELELPSIVKIHLVVNVSRIQQYIGQVEEQRKKQQAPVIIEREERQECEERVYKRGELPGRFIARKLFGWSDKRYNQEYWSRLERNWRR